MVIPYRPFEKTYRAPSLGIKNPKKGFLYGFLTFEDGIRKFPETLVGNYHYSLCNNPEEGSSHLLGGGSLKS